MENFIYFSNSTQIVKFLSNKLEYFIRPIKTCLVNCWPFGKYVHLLYMYAILGKGNMLQLLPQFSMAWRWSVCGTAEVVWKPRFLWQWPSAHLHFLVSCFSLSSWQYPIDSLWGSGLVSLLASQAHQHHGHLTNFWCFWQCGQVPDPSGKWNQHL